MVGVGDRQVRARDLARRKVRGWARRKLHPRDLRTRKGSGLRLEEGPSPEAEVPYSITDARLQFFREPSRSYKCVFIEIYHEDEVFPFKRRK